MATTTLTKTRDDLLTSIYTTPWDTTVLLLGGWEDLPELLADLAIRCAGLELRCSGFRACMRWHPHSRARPAGAEEILRAAAHGDPGRMRKLAALVGGALDLRFAVWSAAAAEVTLRRADIPRSWLGK